MTLFLKKRPTWLAFLLSFLGISSCQVDDFSIPCDATIPSGLLEQHIRGMSVVAAQSPIQGAPMQKLHQLGVNSVSLMPYCYYTPGDPTIDETSRCVDPMCPHGPSVRAAVLEGLQRAKSENLAVMIKPQLWAMEEWVGHLTFSTEQEWHTFEQNYTNFLMEWVRIAASNQVEYFCIGTELRHFVAQRPNYWRGLIAQIRTIYAGELTYAANWDDYQEVSFWEDLDYVGVDAYFPLDRKAVPTVCALQEAWAPYKEELAAYSKAQQTPILFTEFGYLSVKGAAYNTWTLEERIHETMVSEEAQANALQALLVELSQETWWVGGFQWKWYADAISAKCEWDLNRDYTPENKKAEEVLRLLYQ
ncbi:MAG: glycoside hydrolase family 113 [Aureispira sp.]